MEFINMWLACVAWRTYGSIKFQLRFSPKIKVEGVCSLANGVRVDHTLSVTNGNNK